LPEIAEGITTAMMPSIARRPGGDRLSLQDRGEEWAAESKVSPVPDGGSRCECSKETADFSRR